MPDNLLIAAFDQAEQSDPVLKGIAFLRIARVMAVEDRSRAEQLMEAGIGIITELPEKPRSILLTEAAPLAGTVSPQRAFDLIPMMSSERGPASIDRIIIDLLSHGHVQEAIDYLAKPRREQDYPYLGAVQAMAHCRADRGAQLRIFRGAVAAMMAGENPNSYADWEFLRLFKSHWKVLPEEETAAAVRQLVERILQDPDGRGDMNSGGPEDHIRFSSTKQWRLFELFAPLRATVPDLAEALVERFDQLAEAVKRYPYGYDIARQAAAAPAVDNAPKPGVDIEWDDVNFTWIPVSEWLERILPRKLERALELCRYDLTPDPNTAPRECWPSTHDLRTVFYLAGRYEGAAAARHLDRIPDPGLRLLAQIELCAALAGLSQVGGAVIPRQSGERERPHKPSPPMVTAESVRWKENGRPHRVEVETAQWNAGNQSWDPAIRTFSALYRPDGQAERIQRRNRDGATIECDFDYDERGRPTAIWTALGGQIEQTRYFYDDSERSVRIAKVAPAPEVKPPEIISGEGFQVLSTSLWVHLDVRDDSYAIGEATATVTKYDSQHRPVEVSYFGPDERLLATKSLRWNSDGQLGGDKLMVALGDLIGADSVPHWETTYDYDADGRCIERRRSLGPDYEIRTSLTYDAHGNVTELIDSEETGKTPGLRNIRHDYQYDDQGNWIERVVWNRSETGFEPTLKDIRKIEYSIPGTNP